MKFICISIISLFALSACQSGQQWYDSDSLNDNKKIVTVNSFKWIVTPDEKKNHYLVSTDSLEVSADATQRKIDQIKAAELATGCRVTKTKNSLNSLSLLTKVKC